MENFEIKNLKKIVLIGAHDCFEEILNINQQLGLKTIVITSSHQSKSLSSKINFKIFKNLDNKFKKYINENTNKNETLFLSFSSRWIFRKSEIKNVFNNKLLNFHGTRLPYDAGGGGFSWRILNNDRIGNLLIHLVDEKIDNGPIVSHETFLFPSYCKIPRDFSAYQLPKINIFYKSFITKVKNKHQFNLNYQNKYNRIYYPRLNSQINSWINWDLSSEELVRFINAFDDPHSGAKTKINNKIVRIKKVQTHFAEPHSHNFLKGLITRKYQNWLLVCTEDGKNIIIEEVLDSKSKNIIKNIKLGDRFVTVSSYLDRSLKNRSFFNSMGLIKNNE